jgi:LPS-assembly protein
VHARDAEPTKPPPPAEATPPAPEFTLTADQVNYDSERDLYEATGNVKIVQADGRVLTADWLVFNGSTRTGVASGDVVVSGAQNTVRAQFVAVDLRSAVSVALQGSMDNPVPGFLVNGEVIERTGVDTFQIERGNFTTCRCPPDTERRPWEIDAKEASVEVGGYAHGKDLWFKVLDVPVLYVPWLIFPVKTERQSGFLMPSFTQSSRNGTLIALPFFWAPLEEVNVMLTPEWVGRRGMSGSRICRGRSWTTTRGRGSTS